MDAKTVTDARNFLRGMRSAIAFAETIEEASALESLVASLKHSYDVLTIDINKARAMLLELGEQQKAAENEIETAKNEARKVAKDAKTKADIAMTAKMKDATEVSAAMVAKAKDEASAWDHRAAVAKKEFEDYKGQADAKAAELEKTKVKLQDLFAGVK